MAAGGTGGHVFYRDPRVSYPKAVGGAGAYLTDSTGKRYLDASGGAAVSCLGHGHPAVIAAIQQQAASLAFAHTTFFTAEPIEQLADCLAAAAPRGLDRVYFVSGGSEGIEAALKMARQYFVEIGQPQRRHVIARRQSFHGNTLGALSIGGNIWRRQNYEPLLTAATHIAPCYPYRDRRDSESEETYGLRIANELEAAIQQLGPDNVMAFVAETVAGATLGAVPPVPGYFPRLRQICDAHGVLMILDEVMCGIGRTGTLFACEQENISPDMIVVAKGLGGGYQPIGAVLVTGTIHDAIRDGSGFFQHGHSYTGHPTACAAALAVQHAIKNDDLLANVRRRGEELRNALEARFGNHHHVGQIRGRGLMIALEFVQDRTTKAPFDPRAKLAMRIRAEAMERGLVCYPAGGLIDGQRGDHAMLAPPFIIGTVEIEEMVDKLGAATEAAIAAARRESGT